MGLKFSHHLISLTAISVLFQLGNLSVVNPSSLNLDSKYVLNWEVNAARDGINFTVIVETTGYVGFGLSTNGKMDGADIFIGGIGPAGTYSLDMHGVGHTPIMDTVNNWHLHNATENSTHTTLHFFRELNTCDDQDVAITNDTIRIIWSYGENDAISYHGATQRGTTSTNFLLPERPTWDPSKYHRFDVTSNFTMPPEETTYWCSIHRGPRISANNHIVAFESFLDNELAQRHTHHFILTMCTAPAGQNATELFDPHVSRDGHRCYDVPENQTLPFEHCREYLYVWAVGGKTTTFPEIVGYPFGRGGEWSEIYYMLEVHYDNPQHLEGLRFKTGLSFYYTDELREIDAGLMWTPHEVNPSLIVPPETSGFIISTHCAPECTEKFPEEGINIFNVLLHSHIAGRKMKFRHFRNGTELPWILADGNYDFNFQQNVHLWEERKVLRGDQITVECEFDSTGRNHTVITGGYSTREEMCEAIFWYYPKIPVSSCGSVYPVETALAEYGVTNYTLVPISIEIQMPWIWEPESLAGPNGMDFITSLNTRYNWTPEFIRFMRESRQFGEHKYSCFVDGETAEHGSVKYPEIEEEYQPNNPCVTGENGSSDGGTPNFVAPVPARC